MLVGLKHLKVESHAQSNRKQTILHWIGGQFDEWHVAYSLRLF